MRSRRHRNPQHIVDVQNKTTEQATPFFSNGQVQANSENAFFQPKLTIGKADDPYEREADAVADKVVSRTNGQTPSVQSKEISSVQRLAMPEEDKMPATNDGRMAEDKKIQEKPIQREPSPAPKEEEKPAVQKMEAPKEEEKPAVQKMEAPKEEEKPVQAKAEEEEPVQAKAEEEEEPVQAKAESGGGVASQAVTSKLNSTKGRGEQMPVKTRSKMESAFGRDFSDVHIHTDATSVDMNRELHAQAFTHGKDIYFNSGKFSPENMDGGHLLAHELTHVVQQNGETVKRKRAADETDYKSPENHGKDADSTTTVAHPAAPDPVLQAAQQEWTAYPSVRGYFNGGFNGGTNSYVDLRPLYIAAGVANPAQYINDNIISVTFLGKRSPAHRDLAAMLQAASLALQPTPPVITSFWSFNPRRIGGSTSLSNHSFGKALDIDPATNPRITSATVFRVIEAVTGYNLGQRIDNADLRLADQTFRLSFTQAWVDEQTQALAVLNAVPKGQLTGVQKAERQRLQRLTNAISSNRATLNNYAANGFLNLEQTLIDALVNAGLSWGGQYRTSKDFMHFEIP